MSYEFLDLTNVSEEECSHLLNILELSDTIFPHNVIIGPTEVSQHVEESSSESFCSDEPLVGSSIDNLSRSTHNEENNEIQFQPRENTIPDSPGPNPDESYSVEDEGQYYMPTPDYCLPPQFSSVHSVPGSPLYIPTNQPHSSLLHAQHPMYHINQQPPPPTFFVENCQINLGYNSHPPGNGLYQTPSSSQSSCPAGQVYSSPYLVNDHSYSLNIKQNDKSNYMPLKSQDPSRGQFRGRGINRRQRDNYDRSNSVGSDHYSFVDSGVKSIYKDNTPSHYAPTYLSMHMMQYPVNHMAGVTQGVPLIQSPHLIPSSTSQHPSQYATPYSQPMPIVSQSADSHQNVPTSFPLTNVTTRDQPVEHVQTQSTVVITQVSETSITSDCLISSNSTSQVSVTSDSLVSSRTSTTDSNGIKVSSNNAEEVDLQIPEVSQFNSKYDTVKFDAPGSYDNPENHTKSVTLDREFSAEIYIESDAITTDISFVSPSLEDNTILHSNTISPLKPDINKSDNISARPDLPKASDSINLSDVEHVKQPNIQVTKQACKQHKLEPSIQSNDLDFNKSSSGDVSINATYNVKISSKSKLVPKKTFDEQETRKTDASHNVVKIDLPEPKHPQSPPPPPVDSPWGGQKKSWSQLFKPSNETQKKQIAYITPFKESGENNRLDSSICTNPENKSSHSTDIIKAKIGGILMKHSQDYRSVTLQPRGLINKNYWCYANAPLQALLCCPSFYQLMRALSKKAGNPADNSATPFINGFAEFVQEFGIMPKVQKANRKDKNSVTPKEPEISTGSPFEPMCVYKILVNHKENQFIEGRQQDAEEMLSCVLNGLHDEMVEALKLAGSSSINGTTQEKQDKEEENPDEWQVQGPKKKSCITRTAHFHNSPISQIFWGQLRSVLQAGGTTTANLESFNTLPLDIQSPKVDSLKDALKHYVGREEISGMTCSKTNQEVAATKQVMLEDLPRVLILQLKRFIYDKDGGLQKVTKRLLFPIDLEITKDLLSPNSRGKFSPSQRKYKLFAIVNHEGKEATKGHYVSDVYHPGYGCWLRCDDSNIVAIGESVVLKHDPPRVPYLLFYMRCDGNSRPSIQQSSTKSKT